MEENDYINFKNLLEYYISHLEWVVNKDVAHIGYLQYIEPLIQTKNFKKTGQGYNGDNIQKQITSWDDYEGNQVCINISFNQKSGYQTKICYLNWIGTGINIIAEWSNNNVIGLYQELFIEKPKPTPSVWQSLGMSKSVASLSLFDNSNTANSTLKAFYKNFRNALVKNELKQKTKKQMIQLEKQIDLLKYKKQIILQGPPGTGKTRLAKKIAKHMLRISDIYERPKEITIETIHQYLKPGLEFKSIGGSAKYLILKINDNNISIKTSGDDRSPTIKGIISYYKNNLNWNTTTLQGIEFYEMVLAKYIFDNISNVLNAPKLEDSEQFKLVQFHPSYTYEDFVRGIVAEPNPDGDGVLFKAENKTFGIFAQRALDNYQASKGIQKDEEFSSRLQILIDEVNKKIDSGDVFIFGDKSKAEIISIGNDYFIYSFPARKEIRYKLLFSDLEKVFKNRDLIKIPINLRDKEKDFELTMKGKYPYYFMILRKLESYILQPVQNENHVNLKKYILIIDEINRANLSSVLGELIYALEYREKAVESMYAVEESVLLNKNHIILPPNLYIIGTMNTADRSVGHIDYAIRRRFAFLDILPEELEDGKIIFQKEWFKKVSALFIDNYDDYILNRYIPLVKAKTLSGEFRPEDVWIGHSYFIQKKLEGDVLEPADFRLRIDYEVKPILLEYVKDGVLMGKVGEVKVEDYIKSF